MKIVSFQSGLGNQIAQYVFYLFLQSKGYKVYPHFVDNLLNEHYGLELNKVLLSPQILYMPFWIKIFLKLIKHFPILQGQTYNKKVFKIHYNGYYFERRYFDSLPSHSLKFNFSNMSTTNFMFLDKYKDQLLVSIHIRRGDYLKSPAYLNICTDHYYQQAIKFVENKYSNLLFVIFSDDIEYAKSSFSTKKTIIVDWNQKENSYMDMLLMACCPINIIANSSFSYWAARLNENSILTIYPKRWWNYSPIDFFPKHWLDLNIYDIINS